MQQCQICFKIAEDLYIAPAHKLVQDLSTVRRFVKLKSQRNTNE